MIGASPFGAYWYPEKPFGDAVYRIQFTVQPTRGVVDPQRRRHDPLPEIRYSCPDAANPTVRGGCRPTTATPRRSR